VLDFTHVLAGPRSARTLAEYGAEVLHISSPWFADTLAQHLGVDAGKYDAYLDLRYENDMATMRQLAATADVFASTYRPAVNERFGLLPDQLAAASERSAMWVQELGLLDVAAQVEVPETDSYPAETASINTAYGAVTSLAAVEPSPVPGLWPPAPALDGGLEWPHRSVAGLEPASIGPAWRAGPVGSGVRLGRRRWPPGR
jgi:hypothetical protein